MHFLGNMAVSVKGESCGCMAQIGRQGLDVTAALQRQHGIGVPQVMKPHISKAYLLRDLFERFV